MFVRTNVLVALCCLTLGTPIAAQEASTPVVPALGDSASWSEGRAEGRASADEALVAHRAFIGFVVGVPMGFWILPAAFSANGVLLVGEGVGVAAVVGVGRVGSPNPPAVLAEQAAARGPEFERGMREGYAERLQSRRLKATAVGATAGMVTGAGLLLWLFAHSD